VDLVDLLIMVLPNMGPCIDEAVDCLYEHGQSEVNHYLSLVARHYMTRDTGVKTSKTSQTM
jgi:hypothetical protein